MSCQLIFLIEWNFMDHVLQSVNIISTLEVFLRDIGNSLNNLKYAF